MDEKTLQKLLNDSLLGDHAAFTQVYNELKIPVFTVICRIVQNRTVAEDVLQNVFMKLFNQSTKTAIQNPRAFVFKIAHNAAIDELRKKHNTEQELTDICSDLRNNAYWIDTRIDLEKALCKLNAEQREIISLHLNAGFGFQQITQITDSSLATVYRTYRKAINTLKNELNGG
ncbi:MAG: RNA polymerase sigma factor [Ruminococcaceae bacterium]|nr:RNA polymerase sigma factor [Oscillospiraceae bacterium]